MIELLAIASIRYRDGKVAFDVPAFFQSLAVHGYKLERDWQPIETAPRGGTPILICNAATGSTRWAVFSGGWWRDGQVEAGGIICGCPEPTHWRPLPEPPEGTAP